ncbi:hypothetical protein [Sansalvadorimonas verongulae]|uniref:hypothetical protein n=1 Tax=Sansalvadorimonas verongulae TaxID=2172824 RepID=UPI0012BD08BA|nr:hypothetical protein [Sansalvadorimonas verongulae]MTI14075.1 hypothetical protein [Sansalvadorimonas verongulae]
MKPLKHPCSLAALVFFILIFLQATAQADETLFTILFKCPLPQGAVAYQTVPGLHGGRADYAYIIGPLKMQDGSKYTLELRANAETNGVAAFLRQAPKEGGTKLATIQAESIVGGVNLLLRDQHYFYQTLGKDKDPDAEAVEIPIPDGQPVVPLLHVRENQSDVAMPDPIAVMKLIIKRRQEKKMGDEGDSLVTALSKLSLDAPPKESLITFISANDDRTGFIQPDQWAHVQVHTLNSPLQSQIELEVKSATPSRFYLKPPVVSIHSPQITNPDAIITMPFFVEGLGDTLVIKGKKAVRGSHYFFQVYKDGDGLSISMRRLQHTTVEESAADPKNAHDALVLHIEPNNSTVVLRDGDGQELTRRSVDHLFGKQAQIDTIEGKIGTFNHVKLVNLMSRWAQSLHPPQHPSLPDPNYAAFTDEELKACFNGEESPTSQLNSHITFDHFPGVMDLNIGFQDSHIHTSMMLHHATPASGLETGGIVLTNQTTGQQNTFSFIVRSHTPHSFSVSMHPLDPSVKKTSHFHTMEQAAVLLHGRSNAIVTLDVNFPYENQMNVVMTNHQGKTLYTKTLHSVDWNTSTDVISVLPLPAKGLEGKRVNLPGLGTCINLLSHAITGELDASFDDTQLPAIYHRQTSMNVTHPKGAYFSNVKRDFTTVPPYRTGRLWRHAVYGAKLIGYPALWAWKHPKSTVTGAAVFAGLAGTAYAFPDESQQLLQTVATAYEPVLMHTLPYHRHCPAPDPIQTVECTSGGSKPIVPPPSSENITPKVFP